MSTDADDTLETERMEKIDVRVSSTVLDAIESEYPRRDYSSRSEAVRDALRDWLNPSSELSEVILADLLKSHKQRETGETVSAAEARERFGLHDSDE